MSSRAWFSNYEPMLGIRANMVLNLTGDSIAKQGANSDSLTSSTDRELLRHLRDVSDLIITSGATYRSENLRPSKLAPMLVLSRDRTLGFAGEQSRGLNQVFVAQGEDVVDLAINFMAQNGYGSAVLECGKTLTSQFASRGAISEFCLTVNHSGFVSPNSAKIVDLLAQLNFESSELIKAHSDDTHCFWVARKKLISAAS